MEKYDGHDNQVEKILVFLVSKFDRIWICLYLFLSSMER